MAKKNHDTRLLFILIALLFIINYPFLDRTLTKFLTETETILVDRIIDGDTIEAENRNGSIRLLGINTPERGEFYYEEAKKFLDGIILNKTVTLRFGRDRYDKYDRTLAYVFLNGENINLMLVLEGFANYYFPSGKDAYYDEFLEAWEICIDKNKNLCETSTNSCASCIELKNSNTITNTCSFSCNINGWKIKAEGRNYTAFSNTLKSQEEISFELPLTPTGDTIFLRDDDGKLVFWKRY